MKKKYIIALEDRNVWSCGVPAKTLLLSDVSIFGTDLSSVNTGIELTPYAEPDLDAIRNEAYEKGVQDTNQHWVDAPRTCAYKLGYENGLNDAWDAARKIAHCALWGDYQTETGKPSVCAQDVLDHFSASEAIDRMKHKKQNEVQQMIQSIIEHGYSIDCISNTLREMQEDGNGEHEHI